LVFLEAELFGNVSGWEWDSLQMVHNRHVPEAKGHELPETCGIHISLDFHMQAECRSY
jgi:hypothetical protein